MNSRENYEGISSRSMMTNFACSCIIFLFLLDNDYTSRVILASHFISMIIEGWKAKRVSKVLCPQAALYMVLLPLFIVRLPLDMVRCSHAATCADGDAC